MVYVILGIIMALGLLQKKRHEPQIVDVFFFLLWISHMRQLSYLYSEAGGFISMSILSK